MRAACRAAVTTRAGRRHDVGMFDSEQDPQSRQDEFARLSEESRRLAEIPVIGSTAPVPFDVEASKQRIGKTLGKGVALVDLIRNGLVGLAGVMIGPLFLWKGFARPVNYGLVAAGVFISVLAVVGLTGAWRAWKRMKTISLA